jgi:hypothetical protein
MECLDSTRWAFQQNPLLDLPGNVFESYEIIGKIGKKKDFSFRKNPWNLFGVVIFSLNRPKK